MSSASTTTTSSAEQNSSSKRSQISRRLLESGEYERLTKSAKRKFDETGWTDEIKAIANRHLRNITTMKFSTLSDAVKPEAEKELNNETRREILVMVADVVRQLVAEAEQAE